jgi:putative hydrolase of the HAD superfamily
MREPSPRPSDLRAVVFDYGAVICRLPSPEEWAEFADAARLTVEEFIRFYPRSREQYDRGLVRAPEFWRSFAHQVDREYDEATIRRLAAIDIRVWSHVDDGVVALARRLQASGITTGILSNMQPDLLAIFRQGAAWLNAFDVQVFSCDIGLVKPERRIYDYLLERLGLDASQVLFVDDVAENVAEAKAAGLRAAVFTSIDDLQRLVDSAV